MATEIDINVLQDYDWREAFVYARTPRRGKTMPAPKLTAKNRAIVEKAIKLIRQEPLRFDMRTWITQAPQDVETGDKFYYRGDALTKPPCGTVACLAGWIALAPYVKRGKLPSVEFQQKLMIEAEDKAACVLGAVRDVDGYISLDGVFIPSQWPQPFQDRFFRYGRWADRGPLDSEINHKKAAEVAISRLRYYLRTGK